MSNDTVGGWSAFRPVDNDDQSFFDSVLDAFVGVKYTPLYVATQLVAGTNYAFLSTCLGANPKSQLKLAIVRIYKPLTGEANITGIEKIQP